MECPRCGVSASKSLSHCQSCGLSLEVLSNTLGSSLVRLEALTDAAHCLRLREKERLFDELDAFQQEFPQVFFAVYLGVLPETPSPPEIAFWLLNHAAFHPSDPGKLNEYAVLMVIDPVTRRVGFNVGYALDPHLPRARLLSLLRRIRTPLWHGEYAGAISLAILHMRKALRRVARRVTRLQDFPPPEAGTGLFHDSGLHSLRASNSVPDLKKTAAG